MWKFIQFELSYWLKTPMVWIFLFINASLVFFAVASEHVAIGGGIGNTHKNAPFVIEQYYMVFSTICLLITTAFMNATANRDFQYDMYQFIFTSPIRKRDYFFGKFIGATLVSAIPLFGISIGAILGSVVSPILPPIFDMCPQERFGETNWAGHFFGIVNFGIPNVIISGVMLFSLAILFRSKIVSFIGAMLILVFYAASDIFTKDIQKEWLANILDPFGVKPFQIMTKYLTVDEKNTNAVSLHGELLANRIVWLTVMMVILLVVYSRFSFNTKNVKAKKKKIAKKDLAPNFLAAKFLPSKAGIFSFATFWSLVRFEIKAVVKNPTFIIIVSIGMILLITNLTSFSGGFGVVQYPVTYHIVEIIADSFGLFMLGFITFYTGLLVWKERDAKMNEIQDTTPIQTISLLASKALAIIFAIALVLASTILVGVIAQTSTGYTRIELGVYVKSLLVLNLLNYSYLVMLSMLFHYFINNRYVAYFAFITFLVVNSFIWEVLEISTNMISFNSKPSITYSDMNGFGPFVPSTIWFNLYWGLFCVVIWFTVLAFYIRGKEEDFKHRLLSAKLQFKRSRIGLTIGIVAFMLCGGFVFYNTNVLNTYDSSKDAENRKVSYETKYKKYEGVVQPRFYKFDYTIDIYPSERNMFAKVEAWAKNKSNKTIRELHFTLPMLSDSVTMLIPNAEIKLNDDNLNYRIYQLNKPLAPNDSIKVNFNIACITKGFENEVSFTQLTQNGTFFNNNDILPSFGYNSQNEISDENQRIKLKLTKRDRTPRLDQNNLVARGNTYLGNDSDWTEVNTTISTSKEQTAVAPGALLKSWDANGRKYFNYRLDQKSLNFYSFISADYQIAREKWKGIDLEVYYDKQHAINVPSMMKSMKKSLDYYTTNFGPYYHKQCRVLEFPRYRGFAQAFPGTMPYGEGVGFITDLRNVTKDDIDIVFNLVAHEVAHQYWAHQVCGANMQGSELLSEGFAQYSALMVMEKEYGKGKMKKFLKYEMNDYLSNRSRESEGENPMMKTENQPYIHYNKASVVMYHFKEMVGEERVNAALHRLIEEFGYENPPYPTSIDAVNEFKKITPDSLGYLIPDLFENITLFSNRTLSVTSIKVDDEYEVTIKTTSEKFRSDAFGKESPAPIADYIDIGVFGESKKSDVLEKVLIYKRLKINKKDNTFVFRTKERPYEAGIDPYNYLIDRIPDDNVKTID